MSDPFFTKKRKRPAKADRLTSRGPTRAKPQRKDEEISSESEASNADHSDDASSDTMEETPAEKRLRIAKTYLQQVSNEVAGEGFDAAEIDADLISARLQEDNLVHGERIYLRLTPGDLQPDITWTKQKSCITSICGSHDNVYATFKNGDIQRWVSTDKLRLRRTIHRAHAKSITCVAVNDDGSIVATGSLDHTIATWTTKLDKLHVFKQHRDSINSLAFAPHASELYSASSDRCVKVFNTASGSYIETLFGHQDHVSSISAVCRDLAVTSGSRDKTARIWKVTEESQLVFRSQSVPAETYKEGSIDVAVQIDKETFVVGSDNGTLSLYSSLKKKALQRVPLVHGVDGSSQVSAELESVNGSMSPSNARWITAIASVPFSDLIVTGSWSGELILHKLSHDNRKIERIGTISTGTGVVNGITITGDEKRGWTLLCAIGYETRTGRWKTLHKARNAVLRVALHCTVSKV